MVHRGADSREASRPGKQPAVAGGDEGVHDDELLSRDEAKWRERDLNPRSLDYEPSVLAWLHYPATGGRRMGGWMDERTDG